MHAPDDTIVAIASPPGGGARGIVRASGPDLRSCLERCFRPEPFVPLDSIYQPTAVSGFLALAGFAAPLVCELYLWPGRQSYTGQPVAELHTLGSPPILEAVVRAVCSAGARPAEAGEFTLRAFLAGRIDLTQAEAVLGVIDATGSAELDAALSQLAGGLAGPLRLLRENLLELLAHLEAGLDFADEDLPFITAEELLRQLGEAAAEVDRLAQRLAFRGEASLQVRVVLVGRPNAGKSSLFNALAGHKGAIVSDQPGTTRDYLTADLELDGVKCQLVDTAGIEEASRDGDLAADDAAAQGMAPAQDRSYGTHGTNATVESKAQGMSHEQLRTAHVQVLCLEAGSEEPGAGSNEQGAAGGEQKSRVGRACESHQQIAAGEDTPLIIVRTKCDAAPRPASLAPRRLSAPCSLLPALRFPLLETSAVTGVGIGRLKEAIRAAALRAAGPRTDVVLGTAVRCGESLRLAAASLERARDAVKAGLGEELIVSEIRVALTELGKVAGAVYSDDVLDRIFSRFCIGK